MTRTSSRWGRRSKVERLRDRGKVRKLVKLLGRQDWMVDRSGQRIDLAVRRRMEAVEALGTISGREAEEGIIRALEDGDPRVVHAAVRALSPRPSMTTLKAVARAAATWRDPALGSARDTALRFLLEHGDELSAVEYTQVLIDDAHRASLSAEEEKSVRRLFEADSGPVADVLANELALALQGSTEPERRMACQVLVAMGSVAVGPLVAALDDPGRQEHAAGALGAIRDTRAVPPLIQLLTRGDANGRAAAARALGEIRDPGALEALVRASGDPDPDVRDATQDALDSMRGLLIAMAGATALWVEQGRASVGQSEDLANAGGPRLGSSALDRRSLLQRLLGR